MRYNRFVLLIYSLLLCLPLAAKVVLPRFISDGMVLQRNMQIPVWGWANTKEKVTLQFKGKTYTATAGTDKKWKLFLQPEKAGGPYELVINGSNTIIVKNILIGDVWFCSGQSNMEYELYKSAAIYQKEIAAAANDQIRHLQVERKIDFNSNSDIVSEKGWQASTPITVLNFSAVAYFFAKDLIEKYHVPIGLINCSFGGTPAEAWMNENELKDFPSVYARALEYKDSNLVNSISLKDKNFIDSWNNQVSNGDMGQKEKWYDNNYDFNGWKKMTMPGYWQDQGLKDIEAGVVWFKKEINIPASLVGKQTILHLGSISTKDVTYVNGKKVGNSNNKYVIRKYDLAPGLLKEGKNIITVRVLSESGNAGFLKDKLYQLASGNNVINISGEWMYKPGVATKPLLRNDVTRFQDQASSMYHGMLEPLIGFGIKGVIWYQGESNVSRANEYHTIFSRLITSWRAAWQQGNFPFLFVQLANINPPKNVPGESKLASLQEAQQQTIALPNTGMSVSNDIGEWNDVHPLNKLDVGKRLALVAQKVAYADKKVVSSGPTYKYMKKKNHQIELHFSNTGSGLMAKGGGELKYFSIADSSNNFVWAKARISGNKIIVWSDSISRPAAVRYAWADNPQGANLYNKEGLPASCFRTDQN